MATAPTDPFPVNQLPYLARRNVLATMNMPDLIMASTCSQNYKVFVQSLFFKPRTCIVLINQHKLHFTWRIGETGYSINFNPTDFSMEGPCTPHFQLMEEDLEHQPLKHSTFGVKEWIQHLMEVLNIKGIDSLVFQSDSEEFDPEDLSKLFGNYQLLNLFFMDEDYSEEFLRKINEMFTPIRCLSVVKKLSNEEDFHRKASNSNVLWTRILYPIDLATLSVINCPMVVIAKSKMTSADFNSFVKSWINETAATKLKQMHIRFSKRRFGEDYLPKVFDGVHYQYFEEEETHSILLPRLGGSHLSKDGYKIERKDGAKAKIHFCSLTPRGVDVFFVVQDHPRMALQPLVNAGFLRRTAAGGYSVV